MVTDDKQRFTTVDEYLEAATYDVEPRLVETRSTIRAALPQSEETISYNIPAYQQGGIVVIQFAGHTEHTSLNFFPSAATFSHFRDELASYKTSKSAIQFPLDQPLPVDLIGAIARFRGEEAAAYAKRKNAGR